MRVDLSQSSKQTLFVADLEPPPHLLEEARGLDRESDIRLLFTKHNRVLVQEPQVHGMTEPIALETLQSLKLKWAQLPSFLVVSTTLGCLPDKDCQFTWLRVEFRLGAELTDHDLRPVACKLYPENEEDQVKEIKDFEVSSQFQVKVLNIETPGLTPTSKHTMEYTSSRYRVFTFGRMSSQPTWNFRATEVHPEIAGDLTLVLVVALKPTLITTGEISVSAEVQLHSTLPKFPLLMKRSADGVTKNSFKLSGGAVI
jgi:hypothetical protein